MKQKKKSTAGRKPAGPFAHNTSQLTIRMPDDLRAELERSAQKKGWSLSQELLWRVRSSYRQQHEVDRRWPATRAICYLISDLTEKVGFFDVAKWHRNPFAFRLFRLTVARVLEALEPAGDLQSPYARVSAAFRKMEPAPPERFAPHTEVWDELGTPEAIADHIAKGVMDEMLHPRVGLREGLLHLAKQYPEDLVARVAEYMLDDLYAIEDVRRDLGIGQAGRMGQEIKQEGGGQ